MPTLNISGCLEYSFQDSEAMTELSTKEHCNQLVMSATGQNWDCSANADHL
jgi:hypothetical protein